MANVAGKGKDTRSVEKSVDSDHSDSKISKNSKISKESKDSNKSNKSNKPSKSIAKSHYDLDERNVYGLHWLWTKKVNNHKQNSIDPKKGVVPK